MNSQAQPWVEEQDAIQQLALEECVKRQRVEHDVRVLILPAGRCRLAGRFAQLGARVTVALRLRRVVSWRCRAGPTGTMPPVLGVASGCQG